MFFLRQFLLLLVLSTISCIISHDGVNAMSTKTTNIEKERMKDVKKHIEIRLVRKDWQPDGLEIECDVVLNEFPNDDPDSILFSEFDYLYHARSLDQSLELFANAEFGYDSKLETIVILRPPTGGNDDFAQITVKALAMRNFIKNYNVFTVYFDLVSTYMENVIYLSIFGFGAKYRVLGSALSSAFDKAIKGNLLNVEKINIIGFCYSSQLAGYVGRYLKNKRGEKIKSILALDPYSVGLSALSRTALSATDAQVVHIYHTNSLGIGTLYRRGTADFVFNGGNFQPGCIRSPNHTCSHDRSMKYAWYALLFKGRFMARSCSNHWLFYLCFCQRREVVALTYPLDTEAKGKYYLYTDKKRPYGLREKGASCPWK